MREGLAQVGLAHRAEHAEQRHAHRTPAPRPQPHHGAAGREIPEPFAQPFERSGLGIKPLQRGVLETRLKSEQQQLKGAHKQKHTQDRSVARHAAELSLRTTGGKKRATNLGPEEDDRNPRFEHNTERNPMCHADTPPIEAGIR